MRKPQLSIISKILNTVEIGWHEGHLACKNPLQQNPVGWRLMFKWGEVAQIRLHSHWHEYQ